MNRKSRLLLLSALAVILVFSAIGVFSLILLQQSTLPQKAKADIAPVTETINLVDTKITLVKNNKEVNPTDNIIAGEIYEISGKVSKYPLSILGDSKAIYNYTNTEVGIVNYFRPQNTGIGDPMPRIYARINKDNKFSFVFKAAESSDIGSYVQMNPIGLFNLHQQIAYTNISGKKGYLNPSSKVVK
ncbi:MAG: hypothetical protein WCO33_00600 [bacterium]